MARRRGNNEGCIYLRKDGRWCAQVSLNGRRLTKYGKTQRECREWVKDTVTKIGNGLTFQGTRVTLDEFIKTWLDGKELSRRPQTISQYRSLVTQHILPHMGGMRIQEIHPVHLKQLYLLKKEEGRGARTVQMIHTVMHAVLKQAVKEGILGRNPADAVDRPKVEVAERHILTEEQAQHLIIATTGTRYGTLIYMALMTGMREGELLGLKWSDVDWTKGQLRVQRQLQVMKVDGSVMVPPKTKAGRRQITLGPGTLDRLTLHREQQELEKKARGARWEENDLVFPNTLGKPLSSRNMYEEYKHLLSKNGLPDINFHALRHTSLTFLLDMGTPVNTVQPAAGRTLESECHHRHLRSLPGTFGS